MKRALILANLGSPEAPTPEKVREYLREFLMDPYVIDLPHWIRYALVHGMILPKRAHVSAEAYRKIWTDRGSPLRVHLEDLARGVGDLLGEGWIILPAMRYGQPSFAHVLSSLPQELEEIVFFPLYPQYAEATTESSIREFRRHAERIVPRTPFRVVEQFYDSPAFQTACVGIAQPLLERQRPDFLLFSFHGLPERQAERARKISKGKGERYCYRSQCHATAEAIASGLGLSRDRFSVSFQSRMGKGRWIGPYTEEVCQKLANDGVRHLAVAAPSFVADCLETIEEIGIRGRERFLAHGGSKFTLVPSLNAAPEWARAVAQIASASVN